MRITGHLFLKPMKVKYDLLFYRKSAKFFPVAKHETDLPCMSALTVANTGLSLFVVIHAFAIPVVLPTKGIAASPYRQNSLTANIVTSFSLSLMNSAYISAKIEGS